MEMLYLLIAFVIGGVVGGVIMSLRKSGDEALRIELAKLQSEKQTPRLTRRSGSKKRKKNCARLLTR